MWKLHSTNEVVHVVVLVFGCVDTELEARGHGQRPCARHGGESQGRWLHEASRARYGMAAELTLLSHT